MQVRRCRVLWCAISLCALLTNTAAADEPTSPEWIWNRADRMAAQDAALQHKFSLVEPTHTVRLKCVADYCAVDVVIDGVKRLTVEQYAPLVERELPLRLAAGEHTVLLRCRGADGPSAVAVTLDFMGIGADAMTTVATSDTWPSSSSFGSVAAEFWGIGARPAKVSAFDDYEQWRDAAATPKVVDDIPKFVLPDGFAIDRIRRATPEEGSWVSLAVDAKGRFIVAREDQGLLRMTPAKDGKTIGSVETINTTLKECRGLAFHDGSLFANANNSKALFRLRDTNGDDRFDETTQLRSFPGGVGHGRNDLAVGTNKNLYSIHGDAVEIPTGNITDRTSPFRSARHGNKSVEGALLRTTPDGNNWQVVCAGLRNPFGVAFHPKHGEPFTYDADAEFDMGAPWYRPTRILHLVSGADYGWRGVTGQWPPYFADRADNSVAVCDLGKGSPTAVKFGTESNFPPHYRRALFVLDWAYGRIVAVHLMPNGSSYRAQSELFARGTPLNVTDLDFGSDGAMYLVTGGRKTQSALYRIRYVGSHKAAPKATPQHIARQKFADRARAIRRQLEALHGSHESAVQLAWKYLGHADPVLRHAARIAIEHQPLASWAEQAWDEPDTRIRTTALLALARSGSKKHTQSILGSLNQFKLSELEPPFVRAALRTYSLCLAAIEAPSVPVKVQTAERLAGLFPRPTVESVGPIGLGRSVNHDLAQLLISLDHAPATAATMKLLSESTTQNNRLHYLHLTRAAQNGWWSGLRRDWFLALNDAAKYPGGRGLPGFLDSMRTDAVASLDSNEKKDLAAFIKPPANSVTDEPLPQRAIVRNWTLAELKLEAASTLTNRNFDNGKQMFRAALCSRCHRVGPDGSAFGPDLTSAGSRFAANDLLQSIVTPSAVIAEPYRAVNIVTTAGKSYSGQLLTSGDYRARSIRLVPDPLKPSVVIEVPKKDVESHEISDVSPMPMGLLNTLSREDILDLLAYLIAAGDDKNERFGSGGR